MATIQFNAYTIHEVTPHSVSIQITFAGGPPFPTEKIEATRVADIQPEFDAYVERARQSGKKLQLSAMVRQGRSPTGFDKVFRDPVSYTHLTLPTNREV